MGFAHRLLIVLTIGKHTDIFREGGDFLLKIFYGKNFCLEEGFQGVNFPEKFYTGIICQNSCTKFTHFPREKFSMGDYHQE